MSEEYYRVIDFLPTQAEKIPIKENKFLFFFHPAYLDNTMIMELRLETGAQLLALCFLIELLSTFKNILDALSILNIILYFFESFILFLVSFYTYYSTIHQKIHYIKFAYLIASVIILIRLLDYFIRSCYLIFCFLNPFHDDFFDLDFLTYVFGKGVYLFIYLYLIWIYYCFMVKPEGHGEINLSSQLIFNTENEVAQENQNVEDLGKKL